VARSCLSQVAQSRIVQRVGGGARLAIELTKWCRRAQALALGGLTAVLPLSATLLPGAALAAADTCGVVDTTPIERLRDAEAGPAIGSAIRTTGVVTGDFRGDDGLRGFFVQSADRTADAALPHGIFAFTPDMDAGSGGFGPGDRVIIEGEMAEYRGQRQIAWVERVQVCASPGLPTPVDLPFPAEPAARAATWPRYRGLRIRLDQPATVTGSFHLARHGTLVLASGPRLLQPTQDGGSSPRDNAARRLLLDDGSYTGSPRPVPYLDADDTRRLGSTLADPTGVLARAFGAWRLHPIDPAGVDFRPHNPRPPAPAGPPGTTRIAGFNIENYFLTLGQRGASTAAELAAQRRRLAAVAADLTPDLLGLVEVENRPAAVADLAERLGRAAGREAGFAHFGLDAPVGDGPIRVALAWNPDRVQRLAGPFVDRAAVHDRPPVAGLFRLGPDDPGTLIAVIHHKSKGECPDTGDVDRGQGCWNQRRREQSQALLAFLEAHAERLQTQRILVIGDINSYALEQPVGVLRDAGFVDLFERRPPAERYTYVYRGAAGTLDVALASPALADSVALIRAWHINADEPAALHTFGETGGPWRSSDHDPVIVDIDASGRAGTAAP